MSQDTPVLGTDTSTPLRNTDNSVPTNEEFELKHHPTTKDTSCSFPGHCSKEMTVGQSIEPRRASNSAIIVPNLCKTKTVVSLKKPSWPKWLRIGKSNVTQDVYYTSALPADVVNRSNGRLEALESLTQTKWEPPERETWDQKADFLLSIIGFAVDLANVWRFPFLCYKNGGGAFLIPYVLMLIFGALPLFYMELVLGQYNRLGPVSVWRICPIFKGVGFCAVLVAFYASFYYNVIICWSFYFLFSSFSAELPWTHCNNTWNTEFCWDGRDHSNFSRINTSFSINQTLGENSTNYSIDAIPTSASAAREYFERAVLELHLSDGIHDLGDLKWQLVLCLMLVYIILYLALFKGVKSSGKVVWVTATMPYVVLLILLIRGSLLPGAGDGIMYFVKPDLNRLSQSQVWVDAAVQIFYSVGAGFGVHLSYASYNTFNNNCYRDCLITTVVNSFTSIFSGLVIFTYLGYMAQRQNVPINKVATEGPGLVFQVYPEAIATLPGSQFWAVLFFLCSLRWGWTVHTVIIKNFFFPQMGGLECVVTGLLDEFRHMFKGCPHLRQLFTAVVVFASFFVALVNVTRGGGYVFNWFDTYAAGISLLCSALFEAIVVAWFYGLDRFSLDISEMLGFKPGFYWRICWKIISPSFLVTVIVCALLFKQPLMYNEYVYPSWAEIVGWIFGLTSVAAIPLWAIYYLCRSKGTLRQKIALGISPEREHDSIRPHFTNVKRFTLKHWLEDEGQELLSPSPHTGYKVLRLLPQEQSQLNAIHQLQENLPNKIDFWSEPRFLNNTVDIMVKPNEIENLIDFLQQSKIPHTIMIDDVQRMLDEDVGIDDDSEHIGSRSTITLSWTKYCRVNKINQYLDELAASHPNIVEVITIGKSYEGRPLKVIKIGDTQSTVKKPAIWIDAGIHAREWIAPAAATYIINQLVNNYAENSELSDDVDWYILPVVNPDGYEYSHTNQRMWRKTRSPSVFNCKGTDANRNFGFHWNRMFKAILLMLCNYPQFISSTEGGSSSNGCSDTFHGTKAFSEPETKAIANFILKNKDTIKLYLSFHSYGQMWLTPWGYTSSLPSDYSDLTSLAKKATAALSKLYKTSYKIGSSTNVLYVATGGSDDWAKGTAGIKYAYTVELRDNGRYGFALPASLILPTVQETWEAVKVLGREINSLY
uniref:Transporter n=1 Tax=Strigamia maritima TaxID=126957 RepID=T1J4W0_STRMM